MEALPRDLWGYIFSVHWPKTLDDGQAWMRYFKFYCKLRSVNRFFRFRLLAQPCGRRDIQNLIIGASLGCLDILVPRSFWTEMAQVISRRKNMPLIQKEAEEEVKNRMKYLPGSDGLMGRKFLDADNLHSDMVETNFQVHRQGFNRVVTGLEHIYQRQNSFLG